MRSDSDRTHTDVRSPDTSVSVPQVIESDPDGTGRRFPTDRTSAEENAIVLF